MAKDHIDLTKLATELLAPMREAGAAIMRLYNEPPEATIKSDGSPVTAADQAAENILLPRVRACMPGVQIISEENASSHTLPSETTFFLIDPLDGTKEFLKRDGRGAFTVNCALIQAGYPTLGLVYAPALDRMFYATRDGGAFEIRGGVQRALHVRPAPTSDGVVAIASVSHTSKKTATWLKEQGISQQIMLGSSIKFCLVAAGEADVYPRFAPTMEWDTAAGDAVLRAAGGCVQDANDRPLIYGKAGYRNDVFIAYGDRSWEQLDSNAPDTSD